MASNVFSCLWRHSNVKSLLTHQWRRLLIPLQLSVKLSTHSTSEDYKQIFTRSIQSPEEFWHEKAKEITWFKEYDQVLDFSNPPYSKW